MKTHVILDLQTGQLYTVGRDGTRYTAAEVTRAQFRAKRGDEAARAIIANIDRTDEFADTDPVEVMKRFVHDCPECRAALARGEAAHFGVPMLDEVGARAERDRPKKLRWREQRRVRR